MSTSSKVRQRKAARESERKRQQQTYLLIGIVAVAVVAVVLIVLAGLPVEAPVSADVGAQYAGIARGLSVEGMPQLGSPDAPVTIHEYSAFTCPHCADFHDNQFQQLLDNEIRAGQVRFVFVPVVLGQQSIPANKAAFCALDQNAFWEMHDVLFSWQQQFGSAAFSEARILQGARQLGLDEAAFSACMNDAQTQRRVEASTNLFSVLAARYPDGEVTGTPTLTFNGEAAEYTPGRRSGGWPIDFIRQRINALLQAGS